MFHHEVSKRKSTNVRVTLFRAFNAALGRLAPVLAAKLAVRTLDHDDGSRTPPYSPRPGGHRFGGRLFVGIYRQD